MSKTTKHFLWYTPEFDYIAVYWWNADGYPISGKNYVDDTYESGPICFTLDYFI